MHSTSHNRSMVDECLTYSLMYHVQHPVVTLYIGQWLYVRQIELLHHFTRSGCRESFEALLFVQLHGLPQLFFVFIFKLLFINWDVVVIADFGFIVTRIHVEVSSGPIRRAKRCVDVKFNTLSPGAPFAKPELRTKRASQFDL